MRSGCTRGRMHGFTLLELLVAMAIFGVLGAMALGGLNAVLDQQEIARKQLERLQRVQRAVRIMTTDFSQLNPRISRDQLGQPAEPPLLAPCRSDALICLTRDGWRNPFWRQPRGTLQRVRYRHEDEQLIRDSWPVMDPTLSNEPRSEVLLDHVDGLEIGFLDSFGQAQEEWPDQETTGGEVDNQLPMAVSITIRLADWGEIVRIIEVAS